MVISKEKVEHHRQNNVTEHTQLHASMTEVLS